MGTIKGFLGKWGHGNHTGVFGENGVMGTIQGFFGENGVMGTIQGYQKGL
jgi:hypothetical protein